MLPRQTNDKLFSYNTQTLKQVIQMSTDFIVVLVTAKDLSEAEKIIQYLLDEKLIACANVIPASSCFIWQGKIERAEECLVIMKTKKTLFEELTHRVKALHSYEVPEVLALSIVDGSPDYLNWLSHSLKK